MRTVGSPIKPNSRQPQAGRRRGKADRQRGMAVASSMLVLLGVMALMLIGLTGLAGGSGSGAASTTANALQMTTARSQESAAAETAASGIELTLQWLHSLPAPPAQTAAFAPALWGAALSGSPQRAVVNFPNPADAGQTFSVLIYPDSGNASNVQKQYLIESTGTCGTTVQVVRAYVQQVSFAKFGYFSDNSAPNSYWASGTTSFDGPVHCNNSDGTPENIVWKSGSSTPIFLSTDPNAVSVSGASIHWFLNTPATAVSPQSAADWNSLAAGGQASVHAGVPAIPFPTSSAVQQQAALAGQSPPSQIGVFVPSSGGLLGGILVGGTATGGLYVHGDISQMTLALGAASIQAITVQQTDAGGYPLTTLVTLNPLLNQTIVAVTQSPGPLHLPLTTTTTYSGATNGVVYCDGNIGSQTVPKTGGLNGVIADNQVSNGGGLLGQNRLTIATAAGKNMNINGSLVYNTPRLIDVNGYPLSEALDPIFTQKAGTLGLISSNIEIVDMGVNGLPLTQVEVDAAALAFGTFDAADSGTRPAGRFLSMGSFLVGHEGAFGTLGGAATLQTGLSTQRIYDGRLAVNPPPVFPTTTSNYEILSWSAPAKTLL